MSAMPMTAAPNSPDSTPAPRSGIYLGFDYGSKRIGVASGQRITGTANPVVTLNTHNGKPDWTAIEALIEEWHPEALIVGIPVRGDGGDNPITPSARRFARQLAGRYRLPVHEIDELLSSVEAGHIESEHWRGKPTPIDARAAQIILQTWLMQNTHG